MCVCVCVRARVCVCVCACARALVYALLFLPKCWWYCCVRVRSVTVGSAIAGVFRRSPSPLLCLASVYLQYLRRFMECYPFHSFGFPFVSYMCVYVHVWRRVRILPP
jgi:hypothetical protein